MSDSDRKRLREIHTFPALVNYLRKDLGWPVEQDSFSDLDLDDLTFDWDPEELGIDTKQAAKIEYVKQLRPLENGEPRGVFFVKFDTKRLPVVALRKLLATLVVRKRATAKAADRPLWAMRDLVFISSYGESDERQLSLAYFQVPEFTEERPALKVLGWDEKDTPLHLDKVHDLLKAHLSWPGDRKDLPGWRKSWSAAFQIGHGEIVRTAKELAERLATLARGIRERAKQLLRLEMEKGPLRSLVEAFKKVLIHDLTDEQFADMYAQTVAYGLLSARITHPDPVKAETLPDLIPATNPFLRELMETFLAAGGKHRGKERLQIDFDELGINDVVGLLRRANMDAVLRNFGAGDRKEDPVTYFYEDFLNAYDKQERKRRGVYYTPKPVVSYIVRSVHELLQTEFRIEDGLASTITWRDMAKRLPDLNIPAGPSPDSPFVQILDPAAGTATFLVEVIDVILSTLRVRWEKDGLSEAKQLEAWNAYVPKHLLPRLYGYELMMAPYAIAHLKIGLKLFETGYHFGSSERARIYLTNSLEPATDASSSQVDAFSDALAREAQAVNDVKRNERFTVILGNPPYSVLSTNNGDWIRGLLADFQKVDGQPLGERNSQSLQDDYVKFLRLAMYFIMPSGHGAIGFITSHGFLDNPTFRGMRQQLNSRFTRLRFLDLHGNVNKKERCPDGSLDQNVFDIQQGTAISVLTKAVREGSGDALYGELWGTREDVKYPFLATKSLSTSPVTRVHPQSPHYLFIPRDYELYQTFSSWAPITALMPIWNNGLMTSRDDFVFAFTDSELTGRLKDFAVHPVSEAVSKYGLRDVREMTLKESQMSLRRISDFTDHIVPCLYRPMDIRRLFYHQCLVRWPVFGLMQEMIDGNNLGLVTSRMTKGEVFAHVMATCHPVEKIALSSKTSNNAYLFPLVIKGRERAGTLFSEHEGPTVNLSTKHVTGWLSRLGVEASLSVGNDGKPSAMATAVFDYFFAVLHSPSYRRQYAEFLRGEFPRLPLTESLELFRALARIGSELVGLHLMESSRVDRPITEFVGARNPEVEKISYSNNTVWVNAAQSTGFTGVLESVWNFHIGGYQVCEKWLKDRKARRLSKDDIEHYQRIVVALSETIRIMKEIDEVIDRHGGWPGAFSVSTGKSNAEVRIAAEPPPPPYQNLSKTRR